MLERINVSFRVLSKFDRYFKVNRIFVVFCAYDIKHVSLSDIIYYIFLETVGLLSRAISF